MTKGHFGHQGEKGQVLKHPPPLSLHVPAVWHLFTRQENKKNFAIVQRKTIAAVCHKMTALGLVISLKQPLVINCLNKSMSNQPNFRNFPGSKSRCLLIFFWWKPKYLLQWMNIYWVRGGGGGGGNFLLSFDAKLLHQFTSERWQHHCFIPTQLLVCILVKHVDLRSIFGALYASGNSSQMGKITFCVFSPKFQCL